MDDEKLLALIERTPGGPALGGLSEEDTDYVKGICVLWVQAPAVERPSIAELARLISTELDTNIHPGRLRRFLRDRVYPVVSLDKPMVLEALQEAGIGLDSIVDLGEISRDAKAAWDEARVDGHKDRAKLGSLAVTAKKAFNEELERYRLVPPRRTESVHAHAHAHFDGQGAAEDLMGRRRKPPDPEREPVDVEGGRVSDAES